MALDTISNRIVRTARSGTGFLAVFCDLAPEWQDDFRPWLADDMFPPRMAIGFGPAASFDLIEGLSAGTTHGSGAQPQTHVTCYVTPTLGDLYGAPYQGLRVKRAPRDAEYHARMQNQARYAAAWVGPGIEAEAFSFAAVMVVDRFDLEPAETQAFNIWYETEYLPAAAGVPGLVRLRRYLAMEGPQRHILTSEFARERDLKGDAWQRLRASGQWGHCRFAPGAPAAYRKVLDADTT